MLCELLATLPWLRPEVGIGCKACTEALKPIWEPKDLFKDHDILGKLGGFLNSSPILWGEVCVGRTQQRGDLWERLRSDILFRIVGREIDAQKRRQLTPLMQSQGLVAQDRDVLKCV